MTICRFLVSFFIVLFSHPNYSLKPKGLKGKKILRCKSTTQLGVELYDYTLERIGELFGFLNILFIWPGLVNSPKPF